MSGRYIIASFYVTAEEYNLETDVDVYKTLLMTCHPNIEESTAVFRYVFTKIVCMYIL